MIALSADLTQRPDYSAGAESPDAQEFTYK
jgi:hypothetical protein